MTNNIENVDVLNSPIILKNIDCSIPCNIILFFASCCPTKKINYFFPSISDFFEMIMILLSLTPYPTVFLFLCLTAYFRTSRLVFLLALLFIENSIVVVLKLIIQEPRPNYLCNNEYGFPSNHSCFFTCIVCWFVLEEFFTAKNLKFNHKFLLFIFYVIYPFILYSRYYLNYHSIKQIMGGFIVAIIITISWFFFSIKFILPTDNFIKEIMIRLNIENNLTYDILYQGDDYILLDDFQNLIKKEKELNEMKNKLEKVKNNIGGFENMKETEEKYKELIKKNEGQMHNEKNDDNNIDNDVNGDLD